MSGRQIHETVHSFGRDGRLCGVISHPGETTGPPVLVLGAGIMHKVGPSRIAVELSRALAERGHPALRFDLSGIGDSERADHVELLESVQTDVRDAIGFVRDVAGSEGVYVVGFCSGADNGLFVSREDERVIGLALFDPSVPRTRGFYRRRLLGQTLSLRSWVNILTGRTIWHRLRGRLSADPVRPPGYYGLLALPSDEVDAVARELGRRGTRVLYVLSGGVTRYCNSPRQVAENMPTGFREDLFTVAWRPDLDHILSERRQRDALIGIVSDWLEADR